MSMNVKSVSISDIEQNENSRVVFKSADLSELMISMRKDGLLQPVGLRKLKNGKYDAVFGNRRIVAAKRLGWDQIDAHLIDIDKEADRDILGLVENFKRLNTSVAEDGRMFQKLLSDGLTKSEISARLGVSKDRVETALDVFNDFPKDVRGIIVNKAKGGKKNGQISASTAFQINAIRKTYHLNRPQTRSIVNFARQDDVGATRVIPQIAPLLKSGLSLELALKTVSRSEVLTLTFITDSSDMAKFQKRFGKSVREAAYERIEESLDLKMKRVTGVKKLSITNEAKEGKKVGLTNAVQG